MNAMLLDAAGAGQGNGMVMMVIYLVVFGAFLYFLMIKPQQKERKEKAALMSAVAVGDSIRTAGGFIGTVIDVADDMVIVEFGNNKNCRIPMVKEAIVEVEKPESAVQKAEPAAAAPEKKSLLGALVGRR